MLRTHLRRGALAGLLAGGLAALVGFVAGQPLLEAAIVVEEQLHHGHDHAHGLARGVQQAGMVAALVIVGVAVGLVFGVLAAWAANRVDGDAWTRHLRLGGALAFALVVLPALAYPSNPPGAVEDVPGRGLAYALVIALGCGVLVVARLTGRALRTTGLPTPVRQTLLAAVVVVAAAGIVTARPDLAPAVAEFPAELLWRFRLVSIAIQVTLVGGTAVAFGLLASRAERRAGLALPTT